MRLDEFEPRVRTQRACQPNVGELRGPGHEDFLHDEEIEQVQRPCAGIIGTATALNLDIRLN